MYKKSRKVGKVEEAVGLGPHLLVSHYLSQFDDILMFQLPQDLDFSHSRDGETLG